MTDPARDNEAQNRLFESRKRGENCPLCGLHPGGEIIAEVASGFVRLVNDADYRGYLILVYRRHVVELHHLSKEERSIWAEDMALISEGIERVCHPAKLNLAMYGNLVPHLHCHFIPRYWSDPEWIGPPAFRSDAERRLLLPEDYETLKREILPRLR